MKITEIEKSQKPLEKAHAELDCHVKERTTELTAAMKHFELELNERKRVTTTLEQESNLLRTLMDNQPDYIFIKDTKSRFITTNVAHLQVLGAASLKEVIGKTDFDFFPQELAEQYYNDEQAVVNSGKPLLRREERVVDNAGTTRWVLTTKVPLFDSSGSVMNIVGISRDITELKSAEMALQEVHSELEERVKERTEELYKANQKLQNEIIEHKKTEEELKNSEDRLKILFECAPDAYYLNDLKGNFLDGNKAAENLIGYKREELIGKSFFKLNLLPPSQLLKAAKLLIQNALGQPTGPDEFTLIRKDGKQGFVEIRTFPVKIKGQSVVLGIARDIQERKQTEEVLKKAHNELEQKIKERTAELAKANQALLAEINERKLAEKEIIEKEKELRVITESSLDTIFVLTKLGNLLYISPASQELFGYKPDEMIGTSFTKYVPQEELLKYWKTLTDVFLHKKIRSFTTFIKHRNGSFVPIEINGQLVKREGKYVGQGTIRDISERKKAEDQIKATLREKEVLLKEIHHRVKNNLQIICSLLYLQSKNIKDEEALELFIDSQGRVKSMALIHEKLYRSEDLANINFKEYIKSLTNYLLQTYGTSDMPIDLKINVEEISLTIETAIPCGLIINELVSNSLKYAFPEGREGEISIEFFPNDGNVITEGDDHTYTLKVGDNGIGFPEDLDFRNTQSLGLQLVNNLTNQLDGAIELDRNGGTLFKITFGR